MDLILTGAFYLVISVGLLYLLYLKMTLLSWEESERKAMEFQELHLATVLRLLDAPDVKWMIGQADKRKLLFAHFSRSMMEDVQTQLRKETLGLRSLLAVAAFFAGYGVVKLKSRLVCAPNDLKFLAGLGLTVFRSLQ